MAATDSNSTLDDDPIILRKHITNVAVHIHRKYFNVCKCHKTCFSSRDELVSSFSSLGFLGAPLEPAAGIRTS